MTTFETLAERYERGVTFFEARDYITAAELLGTVSAEEPGNLAVRMLLARAYYHSAQLGRAEQELRKAVEQDPSDAYAHLLLGRTLQRQSRHGEGQGHLRLAAALSGEAAYAAFAP
ncbi:tetratricopeptide repeat protein [Sinosporangium siamense]|uniref:Tetratricopeptide repeat protein n=1 Tax=Sinosporangium siamense TaxID=1367973 RepID=A0A919RN07_9ACTN|nr:tetratricopeptide repeat protein [Sinosporangium siamense]GII96177.1 hypothetical protein Ssi02_64080 [Sinosporangium siamense]